MNARGSDAVPTSLIVGCGWVGRWLAPRRQATGARVLGTRRRPRPGDLPAGVEALAFDLEDGQGAPRLAAQCPAGADIYYLVPPGLRAGRPADAVAASVHDLARALAARTPRAAILASSTAAWGDCGGARVDAGTPAAGADARARALLAIEAAWRDALPQARIVRLAGLYGPGRVVGERPLRAGTPIGGDPDAWLNLLWGEDAAALLDCLPAAGAAAPVELGCDDAPVRRREYYTELARRLGVPVRFEPDGGEGRASRLCDNGPTRARTGWRPAVADWRAGLERLLPGMPR